MKMKSPFKHMEYSRIRPLLNAISLFCLLAAGCSSVPPAPTPDANPASDNATESQPPVSPAPRPVIKKGGGYYKDDGPGNETPDNLDNIPDAIPKPEPLHKAAMRPYVVLGRQYIPHTRLRPYKARGIASWYGRKFHGQKTSNGETYNMFAMTAAHTTLPLPSYVRVTNLRNGRSVVVRINDRGPFHAGRIIDLSYTAAHKLDIINNGSSQVEVEAIIPTGRPEPTIGTQTASAPPPQSPATTGEKNDGLATLVQRHQQEEETPHVGKKGIFLQLGAFANAENAENLKNHLVSELGWLKEPLFILTNSNIHRLQVGPYASRQEAQRISERIHQSLGTRPTIVNR